MEDHLCFVRAMARFELDGARRDVAAGRLDCARRALARLRVYRAARFQAPETRPLGRL
ncbi:hypothetical protein [Algiphilus sp.]|uniref:hypothetical protein n=1 Tax=Algiphilus sp. TaxID=1872431 RepID=UPI0025C60435|nr:hypothetical protein [Algiphilus sp.]MCK5772032.1 hypothetical protein [Algiphilus sp.]